MARPQRFDPILILQHGDSGHILVPVDQNAGNDQHIIAWRADDSHVCGQFLMTVRAYDHEAGRSRAGRAPAYHGEIVGRHVHEGQRVVPAIRVWHGQPERPLAQIQPQTRVQRIGIGRRHTAHLGPAEFSAMVPLLQDIASRRLLGPDSRKAQSPHRYQRECVIERILKNRFHHLPGNAGLAFASGHTWPHCR
ncbi:hypothetical protein D3C81_988570 [compost metagenome]